MPTLRFFEQKFSSTLIGNLQLKRTMLFNK